MPSFFVPNVLVFLLQILEGSSGGGSGFSLQTFPLLPSEAQNQSRNCYYKLIGCYPHCSFRTRGMPLVL